MTKHIAKGYKESEVGLISSEWELVEMRDLGEFRKGKGIKKDEVRLEGLPCIRYGEIYTSYNHIVRETKSFVDYETAATSISVPKETVILAGSGETIDDIGKAVVYLGDEPCYVGGDTILISPNNRINSIYLSYFLDSKMVASQKRKFGQGNSVVHLYIDGVKQLNVLVPPLQEQQRIAEILSTTDEHIEKLDGIIADYQLLKKGLMKKLLTEGIGHTEFKETEIGRIPAEWEVVELGDLASIYQPVTIPQSKFTTSGYVVYGANGPIGYYESYNHETEQVAITCRGATCGNVNFTRPYSWITGNAMVLNVDENENINKKFLYYFSLLNPFRDVITGSAQPQITRGSIERVKIAVPNIVEQAKIADILNEVDCTLDAHIIMRDDFIQVKKSLMDNLLTGKVRVPY